jgi:hypothetical protein
MEHSGTLTPVARICELELPYVPRSMKIETSTFKNPIIDGVYEVTLSVGLAEAGSP